MNEIKAPGNTSDTKYSIFLAGSIEMGVAENWQQKIVCDLAPFDVTLLNPRRDDWDTSWVQSIDNEQFKQQVDWELDNITTADLVIFYFDPNTASPITLLELGLCVGTFPNNIVVYCPQGFYRKGNVDILCQRNDIVVFDTYDDFVLHIKNYLHRVVQNLEPTV